MNIKENKINYAYSSKLAMGLHYCANEAIHRLMKNKGIEGDNINGKLFNIILDTGELEIYNSNKANDKLVELLNKAESYDYVIIDIDAKYFNKEFESIISDRLKIWTNNKTVVICNYRYDWKDMSNIDHIFIYARDRYGHECYAECDKDITRIKSTLECNLIRVDDVISRKDEETFIRALSCQMTCKYDGEEILIDKEDTGVMSLTAMKRDGGKPCFTSTSVDDIIDNFHILYDKLTPSNFNKLAIKLHKIERIVEAWRADCDIDSYDTMTDIEKIINEV